MFKPYPHQVEFLQAMGSGKKRACNVWHRRAGKDLAAFLGWMVPEAYRKTGTYYYFFPTYAQGKKIIWDAIDSDGIKITHHIPYWQKCQFNETELQITLPPVAGGSNGSIIQLIGTDKLDSIVGTNPVGCIFSEYSLQNPQAWSYIRPILEANGGWGIFVFTPRGNNWGFKLYKEACTSKDWYVSVKTINQTSKHDGSPIITMDQIQNMRAEGEDEDIIQQEYFCSFSGAQSGSYYSSYVVKAQETGRVRPNLYDPNLPVDTFWDIGNGDSTVIGFRQVAYNERRWVDCYAHSRQDLPEFARVLSELSRTRGFRYRHHYFPHDMKVTEFTTNESRIAAARRLGIRPCSIVAKRPLMEGIDAVRRAFPRYWFDADHCADLVNSLTFYHKKWNKEGRVFTDVPDHDEHSHFADMIRYEAIQGGVMTQDEYIVRPHSAITEFDPVSYRAEPTRTRGQWSMPIIGADPFGD